jgi:hypothetical protein
VKRWFARITWSGCRLALDDSGSHVRCTLALVNIARDDLEGGPMLPH